MTFAREKRLLLGTMALLAPVPLPFNQIIGWAYLGAYLVVVAYFLRRSAADAPRWLPLWAMNVLAVAYVPVFLLDVFVLSRGRLVVSVTHLLLFAVVVKLFGLRQERDKWQTAIAVLFLFFVAMATSVHPSVVVYLIAFTALSLRLFARFAHLHVLASFVPPGGTAPPALLNLPLRRFLALATLGTVVASVPLFAFLPRVRTPFIMGRGEGAGTLGSATGFSDEVTLDTIGSIRTSREVALRVRYPRGGPPTEMRFRGGAFDRYESGVWRRREGESRVRSWREGYRLAPPNYPVTGTAEIFLRPVAGRTLLLPLETAAIESDKIPLLFLDEDGVVMLRQEARDVQEYRVALTDRPVPLALAPDDPSGRAGRREVLLDLQDVSPRVQELAQRAAGTGTDAQRAGRLEAFLIREYNYSLDWVGAPGENPLDDFLFRRKSGHCEYFASALVAMLRSVGIPARLATGYLGAELNPFEGYYIVRQSNAHAWVEAHLEGRGWVTLDPTPPAGRPALQRGTLSSLLAQGWDYLLFRWDRYVLTYGFYDQMQLLTQLKERWDRLWASLWGDDEAQKPTGLPTPVPDPAVATAEDPVRGTAGRWWLAALGGVAALAGGLLWRYSRRPLSPTAAYGRLRKSARQAGVPVRPADAPLAFARALAQKVPVAADPGARVVDAYLRETFGGEALNEADRAALQGDYGAAVRELRKAG